MRSPNHYGRLVAVDKTRPRNTSREPACAAGCRLRLTALAQGLGFVHHPSPMPGSHVNWLRLSPLRIAVLLGGLLAGVRYQGCAFFVEIYLRGGDFLVCH